MKRKPLLAIVVASVLAMALNAQVVETVTTNGLSEPYGVAVPASTNVYYYTSSATGDVLEFDPVTKEISLLMDGLNVPQGIVSARGGLVVSESGGHRIAFISLAGGYSVLAGGTQGSRDGLGTVAQFNNPSGLAADAAGNIYIADLKNNSIRKLALDNTVTTVATGFFEPAGVAVDETGRLFVADTRSHVIRMVNLDGSKSIISGVEREPGPFVPHLDGPRGILWVGGQTGLLVSDSGNNVIRQVSPRLGGWVTSVFAGKSGTPGYVEGAPLTVARFRSPLGLAVDHTGGILVADLINDALRRVGRIALPPVSILPASGTYSNSITVTITNPVPNAVFRYTTDGTDPTLNAPVAGRNLTLTKGPLPLKVRAFSPDFGASEVASNNYVFAVGPLLLSTPGGSFENPEPLLIFSFTDDVVIHFTVDGSLPTTNDPVWQDSLWPITGPLQAQGYRDGFTPSAVVSNYFTFTAAQPVILPPGASTNNNVEVSLSTATTGATIRWTIDGSEPSRLSALYDKPFILGTNGTLKAKAFRTGFKDSLVSTQVFNLTVGTPAVLPSGGTNNAPVSVEFFTATQGADFYWTINGTEPTPQNGAKYSGPFQLATNGVLQVRGYKSGYLPSAIASNAFTMIVGNPVISPAGATTNDVTRITLSTVTPGAQLIWTVDGTEPARGHGTIYTGPFDLGTNGVLQVRGVRDGFLDSAVVSNAFNLTVSNPVINPAGATTNDSVRVTLTSETPGAQLIWTIDGTEPGRGRGTLYTGPFDLGTNGILQVRGLRAGFADSGVSSNLFNLSVGDPVVTPGAGGFVNSVTVSAVTTTPGPVLHYTVDGSLPTISSPTYTGPLVFTTNTVLVVGGFRSGFIPSLIVSNEYRLKVDAPRITLPDGSEASGFIPNGIRVKVSVARAGARIHYTLDGTVPTTNSPAIGPDGLVDINQLTAPGRDLEALRVRAFATGVDPSDVVDGQPIAANTAGVPRNMAAGIGSTIVVPVVINLQSNTVLKTMQMKLEVSPIGTAPNLEFDLRALPSTAADFVQVLSPGDEDSFSVISVGTYRDVSPAGVATNGMIITALGTNANLTITHYGMVALVVVPIPRTAKVGDRYNIALLNPSGTVDGQQTVLPLGSLPARTIEITNIAYRVGDTSPGRWYNAGDFGDGSVDNSDVNNAFYASLGARIPYNFTDVFDAMDVYPADEDGAAGGDGEIRFLDWQLILQRSLNRDTNVWYRSWGPGGVRQASRVGGGVTPRPRGTSVTKPAGHVWQREVLLRSGVVENARPGQLVSLPVYAFVARGKSIAGLQFRARIESDGSGVRVPVEFVAASGLPRPLSIVGGTPNQVTAAWSLQANPFVPALTGSNYLGEVRFVVPETARPGECYTLRFRNADGAPDLLTQYDFETQPGAVWAQTAASTPASATSDEWKARFFADVTSADAADDADPDHDGVLNWQEYQAGTSPVSPDSRLAFFSTEWDPARGGLLFRWLSAPGKFYTLEVSSGLGNGPWEAITTDIPGDGGIVEHVETKLIRATGFYRLRVQP